ncbi:class I adenylate-forming enzyme family protein [Chloroflexota bacterium]
MTVPEILRWCAHNWPDKEAIVEMDPVSATRRALTYKQYDDRVNMLANALLDSGIKKGDMVLHLMRNGIEWLETYFAIIRIGAIVVPLNFRFTSDDVKYAADICEPPLIIVEDRLTNVIMPIHSSLTSIRNFVCIGEDVPSGMLQYEQFIKGHSANHPDIQISEDDESGLYFTSGTTGKPKPILFTHKNLYSSAIMNGLNWPLNNDDNFIIHIPLFHTAAFMFWLPFLFWGAKCTFLQKFSGSYLFETIDREKGTYIAAPLPQCVEIINSMRNEEIKEAGYDLSSLRIINTGGSPYPKDVLKDLMDLFPRADIVHCWGLSEGGGAGTATTITSAELRKKLGSTGKPAPMVDIKIVDNKGNDIVTGETGEIIIRTERNMKAYYKNPQMTSEILKEGWLYSGDIGKFDEDGYLYITDRKKDVIISGGENVYPAEVEEVLLTHPKIVDAAVISTPDDKFGECVTAVITLKSGEVIDKEELLKWCIEKFPAFKRPRKIEFGDIPRAGAVQKIIKSELRRRYSGEETIMKGYTS